MSSHEKNRRRERFVTLESQYFEEKLLRSSNIVINRNYYDNYYVLHVSKNPTLLLLFRQYGENVIFIMFYL